MFCSSWQFFYLRRKISRVAVEKRDYSALCDCSWDISRRRRSLSAET